MFHRILSRCLPSPPCHRAKLHTTIVTKLTRTDGRPGCEILPEDPMTPVAVVLCGCGLYDGTEVTEAVSMAINASRHNLQPCFFSPDVNICGTMNHLKRDLDLKTGARNALVESARIARGDVRPLDECTPGDYRALLVPGGFGVVRTLSDFESRGCDFEILPELARLILDFNCRGKPIAVACIAAVLVARLFDGVKITMGKTTPKADWPYAEAMEQARLMGANLIPNNSCEFTYCDKYNVYSTPAYLYGPATHAEVDTGIYKMIEEMAKNIDLQ